MEKIETFLGLLTVPENFKSVKFKEKNKNIINVPVLGVVERLIMVSDGVLYQQELKKYTFILKTNLGNLIVRGIETEFEKNLLTFKAGELAVTRDFSIVEQEIKKNGKTIFLVKPESFSVIKQNDILHIGYLITLSL